LEAEVVWAGSDAGFVIENTLGSAGLLARELPWPNAKPPNAGVGADSEIWLKIQETISRGDIGIICTAGVID